MKLFIPLALLGLILLTPLVAACPPNQACYAPPAQVQDCYAPPAVQYEYQQEFRQQNFYVPPQQFRQEFRQQSFYVPRQQFQQPVYVPRARAPVQYIQQQPVRFIRQPAAVYAPAPAAVYGGGVAASATFTQARQRAGFFSRLRGRRAARRGDVQQAVIQVQAGY